MPKSTRPSAGKLRTVRGVPADVLAKANRDVDRYVSGWMEGLIAHLDHVERGTVKKRRAKKPK